MLTIVEEAGKIVDQSTAYNVIETLLVVGVLAFTGFVVYLACEKEG